MLPATRLFLYRFLLNGRRLDYHFARLGNLQAQTRATISDDYWNRSMPLFFRRPNRNLIRSRLDPLKSESAVNRRARAVIATLGDGMQPNHRASHRIARAIGQQTVPRSERQNLASQHQETEADYAEKSFFLVSKHERAL